MMQCTYDFSRFERLEQAAGTNPTGWQRRILAQLRFVAVLSVEDGNKYEDQITQATAILETAVQETGAITNQAAQQAEQALLPCASKAKSYEYLCAAHAHIDMNWMWGFHETTATVVDTFRTMLQIMKEYPDFHFSQSQASVYKIVERFAPEMLEEIRERIQEGRWELTASAWVETDKNIPTGESLTRHILYTKQYLSDLFGVSQDSLNIDFNPDTFGHSEQVPEISTKAGLKYYYHCRGQIGDQILYRWRAPSGAELLLYTEPLWYNGEISTTTAEMAIALAKHTGMKTLLKVYGVGDHGGGPTRRDLDLLIEMNRWPVYPSFRFSTFAEYFRLAEQRRNSLPILEGERNFLCDGCYTTQTRIKAGNRRSERLLKEAELYAAESAIRTGSAYPAKILGDAWEKVLFNHFHDIIPGSGVTETREYASALYQEVAAAAETRRKLSFYQMADQMDTASLMDEDDITYTQAIGGGVGYGECGRGAGKTRLFHVFQTTPWERNDVTEFVVWDYEGDESRLGIRTPAGKWLPSQVVETGGYWGHRYARVLAKTTVPAGGYTVYLAGERPIKQSCVFRNDMRVQSPTSFRLENQRIRAEFSSLDGMLCSLVEKERNRELIPKGKKAGFLLAMEGIWKEVTDWNGGMSAWFTGRRREITSLRDVELRMLPAGEVRQGLEMKAAFGKASMIQVHIYLEEDSEALRYEITCDWKEFGNETEGVPCLYFEFPEELSENRYRFDVPFGFVQREGQEMDLPANRFVMAEDNTDALLLTSPIKQGFRCGDGRMSVTLIRGAYDPDPTPEIGQHTISLAVLHTKGAQSAMEYGKQVEQYEHPSTAVSARPQKGSLPVEGSLVELTQGTVLLSSFKGAESGERGLLCVRLYETDGNACEAVLQCGFPVEAAVRCDSLERPTGDEVAVVGNEIRVNVAPYEVVSLLIRATVESK